MSAFAPDGRERDRSFAGTWAQARRRKPFSAGLQNPDQTLWDDTTDKFAGCVRDSYIAHRQESGS